MAVAVAVVVAGGEEESDELQQQEEEEELLSLFVFLSLILSSGTVVPKNWSNH
jgi:hypothetical protein